MAVLKSGGYCFKHGNISLCLQDDVNTEDGFPKYMLLDIGFIGCQTCYHMSCFEFKQFVKLANQFVRKIEKLERKCLNE